MDQQAPKPSVGPAAGNRAKVFVSNSRKDLTFAQTLLSDFAELRTAGRTHPLMDGIEKALTIPN